MGRGLSAFRRYFVRRNAVGAQAWSTASNWAGSVCLTTGAHPADMVMEMSLGRATRAATCTALKMPESTAPISS